MCLFNFLSNIFYHSISKLVKFAANCKLTNDLLSTNWHPSLSQDKCWWISEFQLLALMAEALISERYFGQQLVSLKFQLRQKTSIPIEKSMEL